MGAQGSEGERVGVERVFHPLLLPQTLKVKEKVLLLQLEGKNLSPRIIDNNS